MNDRNFISINGFTLLEVLIVITFLGLITGIVIPKYHQTINHQQLRAIGDELINDLRYVQQRAMAEGGYFDIRFYQFANPPRYLIYKETGLLKRKDMPLGILITDVTFPILGPAQGVRFIFSGISSPGGTVEFTNSYGKKVRVITTPVTARVRLEER